MRSLALVPAWFLYGGDRIPIRSVKTVGKAVRPLLREDDILAEYRALASGLPFYSGRSRSSPGCRGKPPSKRRK